MNTVKRGLNNLAMVAFVLSTLMAVTPFWYWIAIEQPPVHNLSVELIDPFIWPGGQFRVRLIAEVMDECPAYTVYTIKDATGKVYSASAGLPSINGVTLIHVPEEIADGPAEYTQTIYYRCNPIKEHIVEGPVLKLVVIS